MMKKKAKKKEEKTEPTNDYSVRNVLGEEGVVMFDALLTAGKKDIGLTKTWGYKSSIIKFIVHTKQFFKEGKITYDVLSTFDDQLNSIGTLLLELLYAKKAHPKVAEISVKPALLSTYLQETWSKFHEIVKPFCDTKELEKACEAIKYFGGSGFITHFLNDPEFKIEKQIMARHARLLLKPVLVPKCKKKNVKHHVFYHGHLGLDQFIVQNILLKGFKLSMKHLTLMHLLKKKLVIFYHLQIILNKNKILIY